MRKAGRQFLGGRGLLQGVLTGVIAGFKAFGTHCSSSLQKRCSNVHCAGSKVGASSLGLDLKMQDKQVQGL